MRSYEIGLSALRSHQTSLQVIGNNIANAATPGYHRQRVNLVTREPQAVGAHLIGTGVEVGSISRVLDAATQDAVLRNDAMLGLVNEELALARDIESLFATGDSSIHEYFSEFFNGLESVANSPEVDTVRQELLSGGQNLVYQFANIQSSLEQQSAARLSEVRSAVEDINAAVVEIADLNRQIRVERAKNREPADLLDRRDSAVSRLAEWTDVSIHKEPGGREIVTAGGGVVSIGEIAVELSLQSGDHGWGLYAGGGSLPLQLQSGRIQGLLSAVNEKIPETIERLEGLAQEIVRSVDQQHAQGLRESGGFDVIRGRRNVERINTPLINSGIQFPLTDGELTLTVTDPSTGIRTSHRIEVDPYVDSLSDVTTRIDSIDGVSAFVSETTGRLSISGDGPRLIDFAGRVDNTPDLSGFSGSAVPTFSGQFLGGSNDEYTVAFNSAGTIGVTDGLTATFTNRAGQVVGSVEIGSGYTAGTDLVIAEGISVQFSSGSVQAADNAAILVTANSDSTGLLSALGLNSLFEGTSIGNFAIRRDLIEDPNLLAISNTGFPGESGNIAAVANLRDFRFESLEDRTFIEELADFTASTGLEALYAQNQKDQLDAYGQRLDAQQAAVSGVNTDEEFLNLLEVERAYQAAARFISTADETLNEIFRIIP